MAIRHSATDSDAGPAPPNAQEADQLDPLCSVNRPHRFGGFRFYLPLTTGILLSLIVSLLIWIFRR
jgi:hypothetical protein